MIIDPGALSYLAFRHSPLEAAASILPGWGAAAGILWRAKPTADAGLGTISGTLPAVWVTTKET